MRDPLRSGWSRRYSALIFMRYGSDLIRNLSSRRRREGSTAVEFALVALPFFLLLFGILEIGMMLLVDALLETAASNTSRQIRTGQAQTKQLKPEDIKAHLCANMSVFSGECSRRAYVDIRVLDDFTSKPKDDPMESGVLDPDALEYQPGAPRERVLVRIWYEHAIHTPFIAQAVSRTKDGRVMLTTALAFRNEPY
ncbi:TadE/TadG family type IV pilus assembly protein [Brevundimonas diminuta]|uniref:TadE/TadG family type IV pilus assembly protein n=1 Tax=Brevundimonas diminuta TaxID=293 RepID=UPI00320AC279